MGVISTFKSQRGNSLSFAPKILGEKGVLRDISLDRNDLDLGLAQLVLRESRCENNQSATSFDNVLSVLRENRRFGSLRIPIASSYYGRPAQNKEIDQAIATSEKKASRARQRAGKGASRFFEFPGSFQATTAPVLVLGGGAAGLMAARVLMQMGFGDVCVLEKADEPYGIWRQKNVAGLSKNNPFRIQFGDLYTAAAPGPGKGIRSFLERIQRSKYEGSYPYRGFFRRIPVEKATVEAVYPGDLQHTVETNIGRFTAPIVINALGTGKPLDPSGSPKRMFVPKGEKAGIRWQQVVTKELAEKLARQKVILIGLGNSTAEMMVQFEAWRDKGIPIDYKVLTHLDSLAPAAVYRNLHEPELTKFAGDLEPIRAAYGRARMARRIISSVRRWERDGNDIVVLRSIGYEERHRCDVLYTLIGYGQDPDVLKKYGMVVTDNYTGAIAYDYDGEIQRQPDTLGRGRLYPGYFGLGAILKTDWNPNAVVIPGIIHRMYDLGFMAMVRSMEWNALRIIGVNDAYEVRSR